MGLRGLDLNTFPTATLKIRLARQLPQIIRTSATQAKACNKDRINDQLGYTAVTSAGTSVARPTGLLSTKQPVRYEED